MEFLTLFLLYILVAQKLVRFNYLVLFFFKIPSFEGLEERLKMYLEQYNESIRGAGMDLVFFRDAMIHLMRVRDIT